MDGEFADLYAYVPFVWAALFYVVPGSYGHCSRSPRSCCFERG